MYDYYRRSLIRLAQKVRIIQGDPSSERDECLSVQMELLHKIIQIEKRIHYNRATIRELQYRLKSGNARLLNKGEAQRIQSDIARRHYLVKDYQQLLVIFKNIGDALAFIYQDKWDIKPQAFKQSPGFLGDKAGLRFELKILRLAFSLGHVAILNDLTNCLRYGDVSICKYGKALIVETKSSHVRNRRIERQTSELQNIRRYLVEDKSDQLYGMKGTEIKRFSIHARERYHQNKLNSIISDAIMNPNHHFLEKVEKGLYYLVTYLPTGKPSIPHPKGQQIIMSFANELKYTGIGYYPFSLSIRDPYEWYEFCAGRLMIVVFADFQVIQNKFNSEGLSIELDMNQDYALKITSQKPNQGIQFVSKHFFGRLFAEFLSLEWMMKEILHLYQRGNEEFDSEAATTDNQPMKLPRSDDGTSKISETGLARNTNDIPSKSIPPGFW